MIKYFGFFINNFDIKFFVFFEIFLNFLVLKFYFVDVILIRVFVLVLLIKGDNFDNL